MAAAASMSSRRSQRRHRRAREIERRVRRCRRLARRRPPILRTWLSIHAGVDVGTGAEIVRTGHALEALPKIAAAFAEGRLSLDKVRKVTRVAVPEDEQVWLDVALNASGGRRRLSHRALASSPRARRNVVFLPGRITTGLGICTAHAVGPRGEEGPSLQPQGLSHAT